MDSFVVKKIPVRSGRRLRPDPEPVKKAPESNGASRRSNKQTHGSSGAFGYSRKQFPLKAALLYFGGTVFAIIVLFVIFTFYSFYQNVKIDTPGGAKAAVPKEEKTTYNILLTGYGGEGHDGSYLTDTLMLASIDMKKKTVVLFSIPRDLWVEFPTDDPDDEYYSKINAVYQAGLFPDNYPFLPDRYTGEEDAPTLIKEVVQSITGLEVDYFIGVDFTGFRKAIDTMGGIEVNVQRAFTDYLYPIDGKEDDQCGYTPKPTMTEDQTREYRERLEKMNEEEKKAFEERPITDYTEEEFQYVATAEPELAFPCRYEVLAFEAGPQTMDGETALKFARSRKSLQDGGDFNRAARQQLVVEALQSRILSIGFIPKILPTFETLSEHVSTDMPLSQMQQFLKEAPSAGDYRISTFVLSTDNLLSIDTSSDGQSIVIPSAGLDDYSEIKSTVRNVVLGITPTVTPDPDASGSANVEDDDVTPQ